MASGWDRIDANLWEEILETLPRPLARKCAIQDLRHEWGQVRASGGTKRPAGKDTLAKRWKWSTTSVYRLIRSGAWWDPVWEGNAEAWWSAGPQADPQRTPSGPADQGRKPEIEGKPDPQRTPSGPPADPSRARSSCTETPNTDSPITQTQLAPAGAGLSASDHSSEVQDSIPDWIPSAKNVAPYTRLAVLGMVAASVEAITGEPFVPLRGRTCGAQVLSLWKAIGKPDTSSHALDMALVADAAKRCPNGIFSHDIRGEGWDNAMDRSRSVATLCVQKRWDERLTAARQWDSEGRPTKGPELVKYTRKARKTLAEMFEEDDRNAAIGA